MLVLYVLPSLCPILSSIFVLEEVLEERYAGDRGRTAGRSKVHVYDFDRGRGAIYSSQGSRVYIIEGMVQPLDARQSIPCQYTVYTTV